MHWSCMATLRPASLRSLHEVPIEYRNKVSVHLAQSADRVAAGMSATVPSHNQI